MQVLQRDAVLGLPMGDTFHISQDEQRCCTTGLLFSGNMQHAWPGLQNLKAAAVVAATKK